MDWTDVLKKCTALPRIWNGKPAQVQLHPPCPHSLLEAKAIPDEYRSFLAVSNGGFFYPWHDHVGALKLFSVAELDTAQDHAYMLDEDGTAGRRYYIIGEMSGFGNWVGMAEDGSIWFLDHEYGPEEWYEGKGSHYAAPSLKQFLLKFCGEEGRWWFLPGQTWEWFLPD
ncbi:MAG TPA: SMI1/KNR4 family protein [Symbiobacteriaceae bacterium]